MNDVYDLKPPLKEEFTEEAREVEPLEPPEELPEVKMVEEPGGLTEERGFGCVCPQCGFEHPAHFGADCAEIKCPECGLSMQPR